MQYLIKQFYVLIAAMVVLSGMAFADPDVHIEDDASPATEYVFTVNINSASAEEIEEALSGVGLVIARRIVAYREEHGAYTDLESLAEVKGLGDKKLSENKEIIVFE